MSRLGYCQALQERKRQIRAAQRPPILRLSRPEAGAVLCHAAGGRTRTWAA